MARILILGGGFAGITAAEVLAAGAADEHDITVVSISRRFTFSPALVPLVFGDLEPEEVRADMANALHRNNVRFIEGEVLDIDPGSKTVRVTGDDIEGRVKFDHLLIALGRRLATEKVPGFFENAHHLLGVGPALKFKQAVEEFRSGSIVVGLCPGSFLPIPVCESALALAERFEREMAAKTISVTAVFPDEIDDLLQGASLFRDIEKALEDKGVTVVSDFPIEQVEDGAVYAAGREPIPSDLLMLFPPFRGRAPVQAMYDGGNSDGFAVVNELMQVEGFEGIYAAGDIISLPGPRFGYMAMRQAKTAAANILVELAGERPSAEYTHKLEWVLSERYTHPVFFHYGAWDDTLKDFDENALLGLAKRFRERYGSVAGDTAEM